MKNGKDIRKILFVCLGNICRSPAAEGVMKKMLCDVDAEEDFIIGSADIRMRRCGACRGYCFNSHARQICREDFSRFDLIVAMDNDNVRALRPLARNDGERRKIVCMADFFTGNSHYTTVPDPYYGTERDFETALDLIEDGCRGLIKRIYDDV